jgi:hypothetical protein
MYNIQSLNRDNGVYMYLEARVGYGHGGAEVAQHTARADLPAQLVQLQ